MITEDKPSGRKGGLLKVVVFVFLSIIVLASAFLAYARSRNIDIESMGLGKSFAALFVFDEKNPASGKTQTISFDIRNETWLGTCREYIVVYRSNSIVGLNENGEKRWEYPMEMYNPSAASSGYYMAVADFGGKKVCMIREKNLVWEDDLDREIINVSVNSTGYVTVTTTEAEGYKSKIVVYDPAGVRIFSRKIADRYVVASAVSPDNEEVVINTLDTNGLAAETGIEFTTILGKQIAGVKPNLDCIFPYLNFLGDGCLAIAGPTAIVCYDKNKNVSWSKEYPSVYSTAVVNGRLAVALAEKKAGSRARVVVNSYLPDGTIEWTFEVGSRVVNFRVYEDTLGINTGREVLFLRGGKLIDSFASMSDIVDISFLNKAKAVVVTRDNIKVYYLQTGA